MTVPKAGNMLLETEAKFLISPLERLRSRKGRGDAVMNDDDIIEPLTRIKRGERERGVEGEKKSWLVVVYI